MRATLFFDIMDLWKKAERNNAEDILLLRYEKGAQVSRVLYPEKGPFKDMVHYKVFGATVIATNEPVHKILDTGCIPITMPNKPGTYENPSPESALELKERLTAWRARTMGKPLPAIGAVDGLRGRLWDISRPMLQVMRVVYPEGLAMLKAALLDVAGHRTEEKRSTVEGRIAAILNELSPEGLSEWEIRTSEVTTALNDGRPEKYHLTPQYVGRKLKAPWV